MAPPPRLFESTSYPCLVDPGLQSPDFLPLCAVDARNASSELIHGAACTMLDWDVFCPYLYQRCGTLVTGSTVVALAETMTILMYISGNE